MHGFTVATLWQINNYYSWVTDGSCKSLLNCYPHLLWISRSRLRIILFEYGIPKRIYKTSTGLNGDRYGLFSISCKQILHVSHGLEGAEGVEMPYAFYVKEKFGARFLHAFKELWPIGHKPASHSCARMYRQDAKDLFNLAVTGFYVLRTP